MVSLLRVIKGLSSFAYDEIRDLIPRAIKSESIDQENMTADIELSDSVIIKVYDQEITLDLGAKKVMLLQEEFQEIVIV